MIEKLNGVEEEGEVNEEDSKSTEKFEWEEVITAVLEKKGEMPIKKLRKKVSRFKKDARVCNPGNPYNLLLKEIYTEVLLKFKNRYNKKLSTVCLVLNLCNLVQV